MGLPNWPSCKVALMIAFILLFGSSTTEANIPVQYGGARRLIARQAVFNSSSTDTLTSSSSSVSTDTLSLIPTVTSNISPTTTVPSSCSATGSALPSPPSEFFYYISPNCEVFIETQTSANAKVKRQSTAALFQTCVNLCALTPTCSEAIFSLTDSSCTLTTFSCNNPLPANSDIAILVGPSTNQIS